MGELVRNKEKVLMLLMLILVMLIFSMPLTSASCRTTSTTTVSCCEETRENHLDLDSYKMEAGVKVEENDYCVDFSLLIKGHCYNDEGGGTEPTDSYDKCTDETHVDECFLRGCSWCQDYSEYSSKFGFPQGIECPEGMICDDGACKDPSDVSDQNLFPCELCQANWNSEEWRYNCSRCCRCAGGGGGGGDVCGDGDCGNTEDEYSCPQDCTGEEAFAQGKTGAGIGLDNLITGAVVADLTGCLNNIVKQDCTSIDPAHANICGCGSGPSLLGPCEERTQSECGTDDCRWCHQPNPVNYPYTFPGSDPEETSVCVNITWDPLNCGQCGFNSNGVPAGGFCSPTTPFCVNGTCRDKGEISPGDFKVPSYIFEAGEFNPKYYYDVAPSQEVIGAYVATWYDIGSGSGGRTIPNYLLDDIRRDETICSPATEGDYDFDDTFGFGCCGNRKCYEKEGSVCHTGGICDGHLWHIAENPDQQGEVFILPECAPEWEMYPIANVNETFIRCVDRNRVNNYVTRRNKTGVSVCTDETDGNPINEGIAGFMQYACGPGEYGIGGFRALSNNTCAGHGQNVDPLAQTEMDIYYVCDLSIVDDTAFAFASIVDTGGLGGNNVAPGIIGREGPPRSVVTYEQCPAGITSTWATGEDSMSTPAIVPCPGKLKVNPISITNIYRYIEKPNIDRTWGWSLGRQYPGDGRTLQICRAPDPNNPEDAPWRQTLRSMKYVSGNGTIMGEVENNSYACYTDDNMPAGNDEPARAKIGVCCGDDGCTDIPGTIGEGGREFSPGQYINASGRILFCLSDGSWSMDMDNESLQNSCTNAGFLATGHYCCAEQDDTSLWINESYNDANSTTGACFKGIPQYNGNPLIYNNQDYKDVFVFNGSLFGCGFNDSLFSPEYEQGETLCEPDNNDRLSSECLQDIEDWPNPGTGGNDTRTSTPAIKQADYCTLFKTPGTNYYCSFNNTWNYTMDNLSHASVVPEPLLNYLIQDSGDPDLQPSNCCLPNYCWDPNPKVNVCIPEQIGAALAYDVNDTAVYKCLQGHWINVLAEGKRTPDGCEVGYCPESDQCLYDMNGNPNDNNNVSPSANPQCIRDGQYKKDFVCENGVWTSRTKKLALKLVSFIDDNDNFVLMCAPSDEVLVSEMLSGLNRNQNTGATNNFCVLNLDPSPGSMTGQRIIGTTLNQPLYDPDQHMDFLFALEDSYLRSYPGNSVDLSDCYNTGNFDKCFDDNYLKFYYDDEYQMVVFSNEDVSGLSGGLGSTICNALPSWLKWLCPSPPVLGENLEKLMLFNKVYAARSIDGYNRKTVFGIAEDICETPLEAKSWYYTFNYTGFSSADLSYLVYYVDAENATITSDQNNIFIKKPRSGIDVWTALTLLRNPEQE